MSVTLRDAQHLCWKNFRKINEKLDRKRGKGWIPFVMVTDLLEEAGEVAAAVKDWKVSYFLKNPNQRRC
ncbi:MAG: hypothetical protein HXY34_14235 [Candidatus Thorarchaeota archaeon]|nr:hypothetical protein [Candidatus Thorarchaeota archaeon]